MPNPFRAIRKLPLEQDPRFADWRLDEEVRLLAILVREGGNQLSHHELFGASWHQEAITDGWRGVHGSVSLRAPDRPPVARAQRVG